MPAFICASTMSAMSRANSHACTTSLARILRRRSVRDVGMLLNISSVADLSVMFISLARVPQLLVFHYPVAPHTLGGVERRVRRIHQLAFRFGARFRIKH